MLNWHKNIIEQVRTKWRISHYQLYWICFMKGIIFGLIIMLLLE